ncbi:hypothetical protein F4818DRAFT_430191 [Hypoxylon cercidicola]|nr:hypothetical protein F4818DRAFT_430191 [Hypoxylon cercidicola]
MGRSTTNTANWWAAVHALAILGQLSLCAAGTIAFASARPGWEDNMQSDDDEFWDDVTVNSTLPWISGAVGGLTTTINIIIFVVLYRTYRVSRARRFESQKDVFKTAVIVATIILLIVLFADLAIALDTGLAQLTAICGVASIGRSVLICCSILSILASYESYINTGFGPKANYRGL